MGTEGVRLDRGRLVPRLAELARLHLQPQEMDRLEREISGILEHVRRLEELDLEGVPASFWTASAEANLREDVVKPSLELEEALGGAPERSGRLLVVPALREDA